MQIIKKILISALIFASTAIFSQDYPRKLQWGLQFDDLSKDIPQNVKQTVFSPRQKPEYSNKILSFITAIDENYSDKIKILKAVSANTTDFLFFNNKLYSTLVEIESLDDKSIKKIESDLIASFGQPSAQKSENLLINSYANETTKVLLYKKKANDGKWSIRIYYYAKKLFKMLILE